MRILIASFWGIPGRSGAWSTPIDLLGRDHKLTYVMHRGKPGYYYLEGVEVFGPNMRMPWPGNGRLNEVVERVNARLYQRRLKDVVARGGYDCLFCIDLIAARCAQRLGYKYVLRLHDYPAQVGLYEHVRKNASLVTSGDPEQKDAYYIPHGVNLHRLSFRDHARAQSVMLVATLNRATRPMLFVEGVMNSRLCGYIYGEGVLKNDVIRECRKTDGKVSYKGPVNRLQLDEVYGRHQIGVACLNRKANLYVMKVSEYLACGLHPVVQDTTMQARTVPHLVTSFCDSHDLGRKIDWVVENWEMLGPVRRAGRQYVEEHYDTNRIKRGFLVLLEEMESRGELSIRR